MYEKHQSQTLNTLALGLCLGIVVGVLLNSVALGLCLGLVFDAALRLRYRANAT